MSKTLLQRAAAFMSGKDKLNSEELAEAKLECGQRISEIERRMDEINPNKQPMPTARREIMDSGSPSDLQALDAEYETLSAEVRQLRHRKSEIARHHKQALADEAVSNARGLRKDMSQAVQAVEKSWAEYQEKLSEAERTWRTIQAARQACQRVGVDDSKLLVTADVAESFSHHSIRDAGRNPRGERERLVRDMTQNGKQQPARAKPAPKGELVEGGS